MSGQLGGVITVEATDITLPPPVVNDLRASDSDAPCRAPTLAS